MPGTKQVRSGFTAWNVAKKRQALGGTALQSLGASSRSVEGRASPPVQAEQSSAAPLRGAALRSPCENQDFGVTVEQNHEFLAAKLRKNAAHGAKPRGKVRNRHPQRGESVVLTHTLQRCDQNSPLDSEFEINKNQPQRGGVIVAQRLEGGTRFTPAWGAKEFAHIFFSPGTNGVLGIGSTGC
jgi:hypothetical protein